jgi:hypothetical protein
MRQRSPHRRDRGEKDDPDYLAWLRLQMCRAPIAPHPGGDAHHARHDEHGASLGGHLKAPDRRAISLCRCCHNDLHALAGPFKGWTRKGVRDFVDAQIAQQRAEYLRQQNPRPSSLPW